MGAEIRLLSSLHGCGQTISIPGFDYDLDLLGVADLPGLLGALLVVGLLGFRASTVSLPILSFGFPARALSNLFQACGWATSF